MSRTVTTTKTVFTFDELSDGAKEKAREWWRNSDSTDFSDLVDTADFQECAERLGITFTTSTVRLMGGGTRQTPRIYWSGFSSQGDGACFEGSYEYRKGAAKLIRDHAPNDERLHAIADRLQAVQGKAFYSLYADITHSGRYYHEHSTTIIVSDKRGDEFSVSSAADEEIADCMRDFMRWIYRRIEADYEYRMSDENVDESIRINEYEFDESGRIS